ncbi:aflatoxin regulatory protein-domain-containing protein [Xylariales sp. AK1849]|nr:aflatoxin regulatory protein-domain-containing protein [Xylariales sp. AK1849]
MAPSDSPGSHTMQAPTAPAAAPKLRDSCHACAASKMKCSKEKPTCTRCAKRGRKCEYLASRRAGRAQSTQLANTASVATSMSADPSWFGAAGMMAGPSPGTIAVPAPAKDHGIPFPDVFPNLLTAGQLHDTPRGFHHRFDGFFPSPLYFDLLNSPITSPNIDSHLFDGHAVESFLGSGDTATEAHGRETRRGSLFDGGLSEMSSQMSTLADFEMQTSPDTGASSSIEPELSQDTTANCLPGCCLLRTLWILRQLSPNAAAKCTSSSSSEIGECDGRKPTDRHTQMLDIQQTISQNKQMVEVVSGILQCRCSQDCYLLLIVSMAIFKILDCYDAAAHAIDETQNQPYIDSNGTTSPAISARYLASLSDPVIVGSHYIDDQDRGRKAAQLVLCELSRLQGHVKTLSQRLGVLKGIAKSDASHTASGNYSSGSYRDDNGFPFSSSLLQQFETDLRKRLRGLSAGIVERLRHE